ncbi:MAG: bifunctional aldolase/short-chain dehydrogenase [Alphaproteobacteria bacterium]|nr:bifunctional aldolase/short-chain dehydrogenase [Alphaproteobacteria bacterium]
MQSRWNDAEAEAMVTRYAQQGVAPDLALRVYTSRLLGRDPRLVLHGGGNTSVKLRVLDLLGEEVDALCVKGSGWDMANIEPAGLPAVRLAPLLKLRALDRLADEDMVRVQRANLLDPGAPNPSVETLLHAFLPARFVDHTHANAVLSLVDQPDGEKICRDVYDGRFGIVPYVMPGFDLAKKAARVFEHDPRIEGLILVKHGIFTFGADAREAYERMIAAVGAAEAHIRKKGTRRIFPAIDLPSRLAGVAEVAPILRGTCAVKDDKVEGAYRRLILEFRASPAILAYANGREIVRYSQAGVVTPDHTIRTKNVPLLVPPPDAANLAQFHRDAVTAAKGFVERYRAYFARNNARCDPPKHALDPLPRVALVPGLGLFGMGRSRREAIVAADIAENAIAVITDAEAVGRFESLPEDKLFEMEYWSLEQAKLGKAVEKPLVGQIAVITGAAGAIGAATARAFRAAGAELALLDKDRKALEPLVQSLDALGIECDVTDDGAVHAAFAACCARFGGVDIVVSNAGAAWQGAVGEVDDQVLRQSFELNFFAHQRVARAAVKVMRAQGFGGALLFNVSKQAINPGLDFGPYGLPKAATLLLVRQYALEYGKDGIRANAVNADRVRGGLLTTDMIASRALARGVSEHDYMRGNLLGREVTAEDVAAAFLYHATALKTTGDVTTVDGGNIAAALR